MTTFIMASGLLPFFAGQFNLQICLFLFLSNYLALKIPDITFYTFDVHKSSLFC